LQVFWRVPLSLDSTKLDSSIEQLKSININKEASSSYLSEDDDSIVVKKRRVAAVLIDDDDDDDDELATANL